MAPAEPLENCPPEKTPQPPVPARPGDIIYTIYPPDTTITIPASAIHGGNYCPPPPPECPPPPPRLPEPEHCEPEKPVHPCPPEEERPMSLKEFRRQRRGSGLGEAITIIAGTIATIAASSVLLTAGVPTLAVLAIDAGLAFLGAEGMMRTHNKQVLNEYHAYRSYSKREGYHHEPEYMEDPSLIHRIEGASDLPQRKEFIEKTYGVKVPSKEQYRNRHVATSLLLGVITALAVGAAVAAIAPFAPVAMGVVAGSLMGGTVMAGHSVRVMKNYGEYLDGVAQKEEARAAKEGKCKDDGRGQEYDNGKDRCHSHAAEVEASRQKEHCATACR